jgi:hypothetical protein
MFVRDGARLSRHRIHHPAGIRRLDPVADTARRLRSAFHGPEGPQTPVEVVRTYLNLIEETAGLRATLAEFLAPPR